MKCTNPDCKNGIIGRRANTNSDVLWYEGHCPTCLGTGQLSQPTDLKEVIPQRPLTESERESLDKFTWKELEPQPSKVVNDRNEKRTIDDVYREDGSPYAAREIYAKHYSPAGVDPSAKSDARHDDALEAVANHDSPQFHPASEWKQIENYSTIDADYSMADKMLERLDGLQFKDSQRNSIAEFFALLRAKVVAIGDERLFHATQEKDARIAELQDSIDDLLGFYERDRKRIKTMEEALRFYRDNWTTNGEGDPSESHLYHEWQEPNGAMLEDAGSNADAALKDK